MSNALQAAIKEKRVKPGDLAAALGIKHVQTIYNWASRGVPAEYCPAIERATDGVLRCEDLCPDVDWAYLRATNCPIEREREAA